MVYSLQSLRAVFALFIFFHHLALFEAGGSCGVSFFLMLSGFALAAGYGIRVETPGFSWKQYMLKRLIRVYPLHLITLILALLIRIFICGETNVWGWNMAANAFLLQSWFPWYSYFFSGNAVAWCLSDLLFFYALFPFLWRIESYCWKHPRKGITCGILLLGAYMVFLFRLPEQYGNQLLYIHPLFRLIDFILGIFCFRIYRMFSVCRLSVKQGTVLEILSVLLLVWGCVVYDHVPLNMTYAFIFWVPVGTVLVAFALGESHGGYLSAFLCRPLWRKPATWSFSFYMVHQLCIRVLDVWMPAAVPSVRILSGLFLSGLLTVLLSVFWEKPVSGWLLAIYQKKMKK